MAGDAHFPRRSVNLVDLDCLVLEGVHQALPLEPLDPFIVIKPDLG
jgi:hypothetical protein